MFYWKPFVFIITALPVLLTDVNFSNLDANIKQMAEQLAKEEEFYYHITGKMGSRSLTISIRSYDYGISVHIARKKSGGFFKSKQFKVSIYDKNETKDSEIGIIDRVSLSYKNSINENKESYGAILNGESAHEEVFRKLYFLTLACATNSKKSFYGCDFTALDNCLKEIFDNYDMQ
jgi:hypothetical protein